MKRKILAGLLTLCMAAGMAVPAAAATTPAEQEQGADGPKYTHVDHVLNEDTHRTNMDILVMPGESFTAQPNTDIHKGNCMCITADGQYWKYITTVQFMNADLYLGYVDSPNYSAHEPRYVSDGYLTTSTPDLSKLEPITKYYDNAIKIAYENKLLEIDPSAYGEEEYSNLQSALEAARELPGHTFNAGYVNNTGLPMLLTACYAGGKGAEGEEVGTEGCGHVGHGPVQSMYGGGFSQFYVTFYEPYYNINYEGVENYFTEEELADLPDRYYIQREEQQIVLPNPVRPGYHFKNWRESGYDTIIGSGETKTVKDGKTFITFDFENGLRYGAGDKNLAPIFTRGCTVTFNSNGGALKDGEKAIREIDLKSVENGQFFDIGGVIPVREGYTFAGWYTSPDCTDESRIANTASDEWINAYDMQVYAKWEKNVTELTNSDTNVSISLTDGVPEDATLSADTIAQESVLESRPELKEELPGLLSIYDISVRQNGETLEIKDNPMTVKIPLNDHLKGYKYYQAVYLGDPLERFDAVVEGDFLVFETDHLSQYAILGSNTPFETSEHEHVWAEDWTSDGTHHWKACTAEGCAEKDQYGVHQIANGVCTVCKAEVETSGVQTYAVKVNGITVTSANASDILGDADGDGATAYYDPAANTLTLDNAQLTSSGFGAVWAQEENFTLVLKGENQITGEGDFPHSAVYSHGAMTVKGNGSLTTSGTYFGLFGNNTITIEDGASVDLTVDFSSDEQDQPYAAVRAIGGLTVDGATLNAKNNATQDAGFGTPGINTDLTAINGAKVNISSVNDHGICGDVIVSGAGTVVNASSASGEHYGIFAGQEDIFGELGGDQKGIFTISDGAVVTASGGKGAMRWKPDLSGYTDPVVAAGDSAAAEEIIGDPAGTEYQNEKYVQVRSSLEPVEPTEPTDPTDPTTPTDPTDPTTPTDPTDPAGPTDPTTPTDPADPADPTDPAKPEQQGKPSGQTESPQTGDSSDMALWIGLMLASCGGVLGMLFYRRKKAAAGK
ncbi:InlB B-repeat-containing protein [Mediterraneibacter glycyrrhizinilyticus]|nr:InlB B-repeat-containing protein [Mediterraneibacter glycyrrhizinilyticus]MBM6853509.1 InlB B-repeat-containing protein [Mediterraneibacter glycyrrhizinilyticus]